MSERKTSDAGEWAPLLANLERKTEQARAMGGAKKLERQHAGGRLDARARVLTLLDPDSFTELGTLVGGIQEPGGKPTPADALVAGMGHIDGRPVLVGAEDFTVMGGSIGPGAADKRYRLAQLARQERVPLIMLLEGAGHRMTNLLRPRGRGPNDLQALAELAGEVPTVCCVMGASAGHGALTAPLMDFVVMVEGAALFSAGPPLVEAAMGQKVTKEELGGTAVHVDGSGVAHNRAPDDGAALQMLRSYLSYFPTNAWQAPPDAEGADTGERRLENILELIPADSRRPYRMRAVLEHCFDAQSVFEVQPSHGKAIITALARLGGRSVAVVANDPSDRGGAVGASAAIKASRFLEVVGGFHLPVIFLADNPGVMAGAQAERDGVLRHAARMFAAQHRLRVPKISVTLRKAFGFGSSIMAMNPFDGQTLNLAFPGVSLGAMPARGGGAAAKADEEVQADLDAHESGGPYSAADSMAFDEVIDPRELRNALLRGLDLSRGREGEAHDPVRRTGALP